MNEGSRQPYVLRFNGPIPTVRYYPNRDKGIAARDKYRKMGYHVLLSATEGREVDYAETTRERSVEGGDNNRFLHRIADRFRRRSR